MSDQHEIIPDCPACLKLYELLDNNGLQSGQEIKPIMARPMAGKTLIGIDENGNRTYINNWGEYNGKSTTD